MNHLRAIAGIFVGSGALIFISQGEYAIAAGLLGTMMGFFVGESNGKKSRGASSLRNGKRSLEKSSRKNSGRQTPKSSSKQDSI